MTPTFLTRLAMSPGAPALASVAQPVVITGVSAVIDDWTPQAAGVAVGVSLHAGPDGPASFLGLDVHVVAIGATWLVDGVEL